MTHDLARLHSSGYDFIAVPAMGAGLLAGHPETRLELGSIAGRTVGFFRNSGAAWTFVNREVFADFSAVVPDFCPGVPHQFARRDKPSGSAQSVQCPV